MATDYTSPNRWFWSSDDAPPSNKWVETGRPEAPAKKTPKSRRQPRRETPLGFFKGASTVNVIFRRVQQPTEASPLTYHEYVYLLPKVKDDNARDFLLAQLVILQGEL